MLFKTGLLLGRFQTLHLGHVNMINTALDLCDRVILLIGSAQECGTEKNPFDYETRRKMLESVFGGRIEIYPIEDQGFGNVAAWGDFVLKTVMEYTGVRPDIFISGVEQRRVSWLDGAQDIAQLYVPKAVDVSASEMRELLAGNDFEMWRKYSPRELWGMYEELRRQYIASMDNLMTRSV